MKFSTTKQRPEDTPAIMPNHKRNHHECLDAMCIMCDMRADLTLTEEMKNLIRRYVPKLKYDQNHQFLARKICGGCKTRLYSQTKTGPTKRSLPDLRYDDLAKDVRDDVEKCLTRSSAKVDCNCNYCRRNRIPGKLPQSDYRQTPPATGGRPRKNPPPPPPGTITICSVCGAEKGPGKPHDCNPKHKVDNLLKNFSPTTKQKIVAESLKGMAKAGETVYVKAKRGILPVTPGKPLDKIPPGKPVDKPEGLDHTTLDMMKTKMNASGRSMLKGLGIARARTNVPIEENYQAHMYQQNQKLKEYFDRVYEHFHENDPDATGKNVKGKKPQRGALKHFVYTPSLGAMNELIIMDRGWADRTDVEPLFGIDSGDTDGRPMLKICMVLRRSGDYEEDLNSPEKKRPLKLLEDFKETGVKKLFIIGKLDFYE